MSIRQRAIPVSFVHMLYEYIETQGHNATEVLGSERPTTPAHGMSQFPMPQWVDLLEKASRALSDPLLGLHLGQSVQLRHLGVVGYLCSSAANLGQALQSLERYQRLIYDPTPMQLRIDGETVELSWDAQHGRPGNLADETAITALISFTRLLAQNPLRLLRIGFINPPPADTSHYSEYFACPVEFNQSSTCIVANIAGLAQPLRTADPAMQSMMEMQADRMLESLPQQAEFISHVRRHISHLLHEGQPDCDALAKRLLMSRRSLQRRLHQHGTSLREELAIVRHQMAREYLGESKLRVADIAQLLGYSEQSVFSRSFQRWQGCPPRAYRQQQQARLQTQPAL